METKDPYSYSIGISNYSKMKIQPIPFARENDFTMEIANAVKYLSREKYPLEDAKKAKHNIELFVANNEIYGLPMVRRDEQTIMLSVDKYCIENELRYYVRDLIKRIVRIFISKRRDNTDEIKEFHYRIDAYIQKLEQTEKQC